MTATATQIFTSREVMALLGVTYRQLQLWVTRGWIPGLATYWAGGAGSGHCWRWTLEQVGAARMIRDHLDQARALMADPTRCHHCPCGWSGRPAGGGS